MRRRLLQTAMAGSLVACDPVVPPPGGEASGSRKWIDVHCHVFNGTDVPLYEFIGRTKLGAGGGMVAAPLVAILAGGMQHDAPTAGDELGAMSGRGFPPAASVPRTARQGLDRLVARAVGDAGGARSTSVRGGPRGAEILGLLHRALLETRIRRPGDGRRPSDPPSSAELDAFDARRTERSSIGATIGRYFEWGRMFAQPRDVLVGRLAAMYPGQELMLTPATVDYDLWLEAPDNDLPGQGKVMAAIAARRAASGLAVHAFMGFDPWRCLRDREAGIDRLGQLRDAVRSGSVIGVKLYPPMGFAAAENRRRPATDFPDPLRRMTKGQPGAALDGVLAELFRFCSDSQVPIMAHCGQSNGSRDRYEALAGPAHWAPALAAFPELRLNLGHFGGIWDLGKQGGDPRSWARDIALLARTYPNVYADVGYFSAVLDGDLSAARAAARFIGELADEPGSVLRRRLMYGSDWSMIGQEEGAHRYPGLAVDVLGAVWDGSREEDFRWRNAAAFLGLDRNGGTRNRLEAFYAARSIDPRPLRRFDPNT